MDWAGRTEDRGNAGETAGSFFHPSGPSEFGYLIQRKGLISQPPCCTDRGCRRTEPYPCSGLCDADVLRASQPQHSVEHADSDGYLTCLSPVRLEAQPVTDAALPSRDIGLDQSPPVVARGFL